MEKKRYIPVKGRKIYVEKELFDEYNRIRSRQCYHNNKYAAATCELKETDQNRHCESVEETVMRDFDKNQLMQAIRTLPLTEQEILYWIYVENLSEVKAGRKLGVTSKTLHSQKQRILKKLRLMLT